ncbi:hypothetical protein DPMN_005307 [Dreissena polymorpha]|uniref:Uncharacterized protein n=2 Tax=Dreissena polymorpha TaxID=45954 RepID=A0A9D4MT87_DREPO|nr:hypothetical protein DPMN_005307 [Dreissena polymorpha]
MEYGVNPAMMSQNLSEQIMASDAERYEHLGIPRKHSLGFDMRLALETRSLNFGTSHCEDYDMHFAKKPKTIRDPMSHRIIEKRRRDRMNNCLADLSRLIPTNYLKQGQGRIEKTEIIEMAIRHISNLTNVVNKQGALTSSLPDRFLGFKECQDEVMRYLVEVEGWDAHNKLCNRMMQHLEQAGEKFRIMNDESLSQAAKEEQYRHVEEEISAGRDIQTITMETPPDTGQVHHQFQSSVQHPPTNPTPTHSPKLREMETSAPPPPFGGLEALASAQQITQEHLKHDKHLWSLLASKYEETKMNAEDSSSPYPSSNSSNKTDSGIKCSSRGSDLCKVTVDSLCQNSNVESCSDKNDGNVYKFKHNITKRFSEEGKKMEVSDFVSISNENIQKRIKPVFRHARMGSPSSMMSSHFSSSDLNGSSSTGESASCINIDTKLASPLPGFVLHPFGTHYIPITIHPSNLGCDLFERNKQERCRVFHPITIPVNFSGPLLYLRRIKERKSEPIRQSDSRSGSAESQSVGVSSMESSGVSDNSPPPNMEMNG